MKLKVLILVLTVWSANPFSTFAQTQTNEPSSSPYPGRCPERYGREMPGDAFVTFTCAGTVDGYALNNYGPNAMVPAHLNDADLFPTRDFYFNFPGRNRQEMHLLLVDWPSENGPDVRISKLYFFPRLVVPFVTKISASIDQVTLPNQETVLFDALTHEIKGGAFREKPLDQKAYALHPNLFAAVSYESQLHSDAVLVRVDRKGPASFLVGKAQVTKQCSGKICAKCEVPSNEIFLDGSSEFRFADDASFDQYLKTKCGFGFLK